MRQKVFWFDLAICSIWMLAALADRIWRTWPTYFLIFTLATVVMRIILSFALYRREKRSWFPLSLFMVLFALLVVDGPVMGTTYKFATLSFAVMGINNDHLTLHITQCGLLAWLILGPCIVYIVELCKKTLTASNLTWKDSMGAILWKDSKARAYCQLMLVAVCALYAGLAMDMRMCRYTCIVLSPLSLYLIAKHVTPCRGKSEENPIVGKLWLMVAAMAFFYYAQSFAGMWRVWMLVISIAMVAYVCWRTFGKQGLAGICILATVYLGILLPTVAIGYNQYACIEYGRSGLYTLTPLRGVFYIKDPKTDKIGLRDRYGMLIEPVYENIVRNSRNQPLGIYELRNNGYYTLFHVYRNKVIMSNVSDQNLQNNICQLLDEYCDDHDYDYKDRLEVRVTRKYNSEAILSHVKMTRNRKNSNYSYSDNPYISEDSITLSSGKFATGSTVLYGDTFHVLHYSYDVKQDSTVLYNIDVKTARQSVPKQKALVELAKEIETLLKQ